MSDLKNVSIQLKANVYFDGKVISHTVNMPDGSRKTVGVILPGDFSFNTAAAERMDIIAGTCKVRIAGEKEWSVYQGGCGFDVPANSSFEISVTEGIAEYLCSFK